MASTLACRSSDCRSGKVSLVLHVCLGPLLQVLLPSSLSRQPIIQLPSKVREFGLLSGRMLSLDSEHGGLGSEHGGLDSPRGGLDSERGGLGSEHGSA